MAVLRDILKEKILVLDGAMGTMLQQLDGAEEDKVRRVHELYVEAGADIITTSTFTLNEGAGIEESNYKYARIARDVAGSSGRDVFVAGSIGPTNNTLSLSDTYSFDKLYSDYYRQAKSLARGGVDLFLFETFFDGLNLKAGLLAAKNAAPDIPVMVSATLEISGRLLSGMTIDALATVTEPFHPLSIGLNCSFGAKEMYPFLHELASATDAFISVHPNAGMPNQDGEYDEPLDSLVEKMKPYFEAGIVNIVGGCCGTTPAYINAISKMAGNYTPRIPAKKERLTRLCGLETHIVNDFTYIGERANVAGSRKFARLIANEEYDEALLIARKQVENGAQVIDLCMDDGMLDARACMARFLYLTGSDPYIAKVPVMIDSSDWVVLEEGLKHVQGKPIVNSISLKEGEETFLMRASKIKDFGAAVVIMAFDETGQADTYERRIEICSRSYKLLTEKIDFPPEDIVFDPNVLSIAIGLREHDHYAVDYIETVRFIKKNLPYAKTSGGISNLSISFRGNNKVREAMHSVFLYHAVNAGLDMGIVNTQMLEVYDNIPKDLLEKVEAVVMDSSPEATDELIAYAQTLGNDKSKKEIKVDEWRLGSVEERLSYAMINGYTEFIEQDVKEALGKYKPLILIEDVLMSGITKVGDYFGEGKMFLPQVVKSAQVMKKAVSYIMPLIESDAKNAKSKRPKFVLATVKGDVHEIGKNIVGIVLSCNGYDVIDLGVMVPKEKIIDVAVETGASAIGLSGLITPSLNEMVEVAKEMERRELKIPLILGGAAVSEAYTASKVDPVYSGPVSYSKDAANNVTLVAKLLSSGDYAKALKVKYGKIRESIDNKGNRLRKKPVDIDWSVAKIYKPLFKGIKVLNDFPVSELISRINWKAFAFAWRVKYKDAGSLIQDAGSLLDEVSDKIKANAVVGIFDAKVSGDSVNVEDELFEFFRGDLSVVDFLSPKGDYIGAFAATVESRQIISKFEATGDMYKSLLMQFLSDRLVESFSELLHEKMRNEWWGFPKGIRPAIGYPSIPDHSMKKQLFRLLDVTKNTGIELTGNYAMIPVSSVCGFYFANDNAKYF